MTEDFYKILEVSKDATDKDIKKAYRKLTLQYHPDRSDSSEAEEKIRKINEAYETLGNKDKRRQYDLGPQIDGFPGFPPGFPFSQGGDINNVFNMFFNGGGMRHEGINIFHNGMRQHMNIKPPPIQHVVVLSLEQVFKGYTLEFSVVRTVSLESSISKETETFKVPIPAGVDNEIFILKDKGNVIQNCKGDIQIIIQIENNSIFRRNNMDLIYKKTLSLKEALCGFSFEIKHLNGENINVNNNKEKNVIKNGHIMNLSGLGMFREGHGKGNLIIEFDIDFPVSLSDEQRESINKVL
jgi:DnaJ-class molecular chaperone